MTMRGSDGGTAARQNKDAIALSQLTNDNALRVEHRVLDGGDRLTRCEWNIEFLTVATD
ncbi:MAG: hypothetical protein V3U39_12090 [Acidimicrobiia bacterium]